MSKRYASILLLSLSSFILINLLFSFSLANAQKQIPEKERYGGTLRIALPNDPKSLDSRYIGYGVSSWRGIQQLYDQLVEFPRNSDKELEPSLASGWKQLDDLTWVVSIRKGVKFHNGKELTADDVAKNFDWRVNFEKYMKEKNWRPPRAKSDVGSAAEKIEVIDKYTLKIVLKYPFTPFAMGILQKGMTAGVIDPDTVEKMGKQATLNPVGTGPFKLTEWVPGSHIIYEGFEDYWGGKAYLDKVVFRVIPDAQTRLIALQKGEVDLAILDLTALPTVKGDPNLDHWFCTDFNRKWGVLWFNLRRWPMSSLKFRKAIAMGADWNRAAAVAFPKGALFLNRTFYGGTWAENPEAKKLVLPYDPKKARELIKELEKEAGKPLPAEIDAVTSTRAPAGGALGDLLMIAADQLKQVGVNLKVRVLMPELLTDVYRRDPRSGWDILLASMACPKADPYGVTHDLFSKTVTAGDGKNIPAYSNPKVDELHLKILAVADRGKRIKLYNEVEKILFNDLVALPLVELPGFFGVNKKVHDYAPHPSGILYIKTRWNNIWKEKEK